MSHYSEEPNHVRVDFFRPQGKWYCTEEVVWTGEWKGNPTEGGQLINDAYAKSLRDHFVQQGRLNDTWAVCLDPYHEYAHPLMAPVSSIWTGAD